MPHDLNAKIGEFLRTNDNVHIAQKCGYTVMYSCRELLIFCDNYEFRREVEYRCGSGVITDLDGSLDHSKIVTILNCITDSASQLLCFVNVYRPPLFDGLVCVEGWGISFDDRDAHLVAACGLETDAALSANLFVSEYVERCSLMRRPESGGVRESCSGNLSYDVIQPGELANVSEAVPFPRMRPEEGHEYVLLSRLSDGALARTDANNILFPYREAESGRVANQAGTSGAACSRSMTDALYRAILELIERHYLMCMWYGDQAVQRVETDDVHKKWKDSLSVCGFDLHCFRIENTMDVEVAFSVIESLANDEPRFCVGSAASLGLEWSVRKATIESLQNFLSARRNVQSGVRDWTNDGIDSYYTRRAVRDDFGSIFHATTTDTILLRRQPKSIENFEGLRKILIRNGVEVWYTELPHDIRGSERLTVRAISRQLVPMRPVDWGALGSYPRYLPNGRFWMHPFC